MKLLKLNRDKFRELVTSKTLTLAQWKSHEYAARFANDVATTRDYRLDEVDIERLNLVAKFFGVNSWELLEEYDDEQA